MSQNEETFTAEEKRELAVKAVNRLIAVCIRETALPQYQTMGAKCAE